MDNEIDQEWQRVSMETKKEGGECKYSLILSSIGWREWTQYLFNLFVTRKKHWSVIELCFEVFDTINQSTNTCTDIISLEMQLFQLVWFLSLSTSVLILCELQSLLNLNDDVIITLSSRTVKASFILYYSRLFIIRNTYPVDEEQFICSKRIANPTSHVLTGVLL